MQYYDIYDFCDFEKRDGIRASEFKLIFKFIEYEKFNINPVNYAEKIFEQEADLQDNFGPMMSLMRFTFVAMDNKFFSIKTQKRFLGDDIKGQLKEILKNWEST